MRLLLDTHVFLWLDADDGRVPPRTKEICEDSENDVLLSIANVREMQIKATLGKLDSSAEPVELVEAYVNRATFEVLPIRLPHIAESGRLPVFTATPPNGC